MEWLERTGLERVRDGLVREFSRGMRQRLAVARAFLHEPSVLLLDEPFTALDDRAIAVLQRLLREALAEGKTVVMSTHQLREALELATHVALLNARHSWHSTASARRKWSTIPAASTRDTARADGILLRQMLVIAVKDLRAELRTKEAINASLAFALVILLLFSFAFDPAEETMREISGGLLWIVFAFAGTLMLNRSFARELPNDCLDALIAAPISGAALFLGKALANFVLVLAVELVSLPVFGIFYNVHWTAQLPALLLVLALGTWALTVIGTIFSALTVNIRLREVMLPMLTYPILAPALMGAMRLTAALIQGQALDKDTLIWLKLLVGFDAVYTAAALVLVDFVLVG